MTSSGPDQPTAGPPGASSAGPRPGGGAFPGLRRLGPADVGLPVAALVYLVLACLPWASVDFFAGHFSVNGFRFSGLVTVATVFLLAAAVWSLLPAVTEVRLQFPRHAVSGALSALAVLMTLIAWLRSLDYGFSAAAFLGLLVTLAAVALAVLGLLPELRQGPAGGAAPFGAAGAHGPVPSSTPAGGPAYGQPGWQPPQGAQPWPDPPPAQPLHSPPPVYTPPPPTAPPAPIAPPPGPSAAAQPTAEEAGFWSRPRPGDPGPQSGPGAG